MDVLILGAGIAGLAAAQKLRKHGFATLLLEARSRIGGRICTMRDKNVAVELGAELVHGEPMPALAKLRLLEVPMQQKLPGTSFDVYLALSKLLKKAQRMRNDMSFAAYLRGVDDMDEEHKCALVRFVEGFNAADAETISVQALAVQDPGPPQLHRVEQGYEALVESMRHGAGPIRLNAEVMEIRWRRGRVQVHLRSGEHLDAASLLCTLPVSLLKRKQPRFEPPLEVKEQALARLHMGVATRLTMRADAPLFPVNRGIVHVEREGYNVFWAREPSLITAWAGGPSATRLLGEPKHVHMEDAWKGLGRALGRELPRALMHTSYFNDWTSDPFSHGAYAFIGVDGLLAPDALAAPVADTLFFAGEATQAQAIGTVNGAYESGVRAARDLIDARKRVRSFHQLAK